MDFSYMETAESSELNEIDDKSFINQFIDADRKIWERNNFIESYDLSNSKQTHNLDKFHLPKIEPGQTEECCSVKRESDEERKILDQEVFMKYECGEDIPADKDGNREATPHIEIELFEEDSESIEHEIIDGKKCHEGSMSCEESISEQTNELHKLDLPKIEPGQTEECFSVKREIVLDEFPDGQKMVLDEEGFINSEDSVKIEEVKKDVFATWGENFEEQTNNSQMVLKKNESNFCGYSSSQNRSCSLRDYRTVQESHINSIHLGFKKHKCTYCDYRTTHKGILKRHVNSRKDNLTGHINSVHLGIKNLNCSHCDFQTTKKFNLETHINSVHLGRKNYECIQCDYRTFLKSNLKNHIDGVHIGIKNYKCNQCDYQAVRKHHLKDHVNSVHLAIRNHKCSYCNYEASQKTNLTVHVKSVHLGKKDHKCDHCNYQATQKSMLKRHIDCVHLGIKNHKCNLCDYQASQRSCLTKHINRVHAGT
ncbi:hypothetical protein HHI36_021690 [Cryptolaemus montrouzieri]|uniref:C2H2-type domain-containing protein n=1 Tax=Cryptolaemus montrouzieri TaxID=559131 RepID=A0ABD2MXU0_9CUCU